LKQFYEKWTKKPDNKRVTESKRYDPPAALKDKANAYNSNIGK
jgi:hypothetical protein